jgi:hypothetical protein
MDETTFAIGDIVYVRAKALKGKIEKVAIKKIIVRDYYRTFYVDTLNEVWAADELLPEDEALVVIAEVN